jgi:hypothetical protein
VLLLLTMLVVDSRPLRDRARRMEITLDTVHADDAALVADLESRLNGQVIHHVVNEIDYVRDTMVVDVRYRAGSRTAQQQYDQAQYDQAQYDQQQYAQQYGQPQYAQQAQVQYGQPQYAQIQYGQPQYGQPVVAAQR